MIAVVDYGAGNLRSVANALDAVGAAYHVVRTPAALAQARKVILPGVGHFGQMMRALDELDLHSPLRESIGGGIPFLGICLGFQALFEGSEEAPGAAGLGVLAGTVRRFGDGMRIPHMGWNRVVPHPVRESRLLSGLGAEPYLYFAHSYYVPLIEDASASCTYSVTFTAVSESGPVCGVQCHPEKSGPAGLRILRNFLEL
jgi:imidazole glycerol phosphate synthase glutamine amidotransferase subunit